MSITDELRNYANHRIDVTRDPLLVIADHIDVAHRSALEKLAAQLDETSDMRDFIGRIEQAAANREDVTLWGVDYVPLPVDADGVPIHVGDVMEMDDEPFEVRRIELDESGEWTMRDRMGIGHLYAHLYRHHHEPTVEDVLREFAYGLGVSVADSYIAASAAKLRLAGDE